MKLSEKWLREWVNPAVSTQALADQLTAIGLTVDDVAPVAAEFKKVVVGEVLSTTPHPDAKKLTCCQVNVGGSSPLPIVCGAPNVRAGLKVPVAVVGALLPGDFKIKKAKLRGEPSEGMICSAGELGLQFWQANADGILELPADAPVGKDFRDYFDATDHVFDIEITPNRGDCLSVMGLARDLAAATSLPITDKSIEQVKASISDKVAINVSAQEACPRYVGRVIKGIDNTVTTPSWMQLHLQRSGIRPVNLVVDVCQYVMLLLGQPMHAFDLSKISDKVCVRFAKDKEQCKLLDEKLVTLTKNDLVIAGDDQVYALAGIMGGLESAVSDKTTDVFLESAFFVPETICLSARRHNINTDASHRFERGVDSELSLLAMEKATALILEIAGGKAGEVVEVVNENALPKPVSITLKRDAIARLLGLTIADDQVSDILKRLGMTVQGNADGWTVVPPSYRFDMSAEIDLIEELARMVGYDQIPQATITAPLTMQPQPDAKLPLDRLRACLVDRGYHEAITYSFIDPKLHALFSNELPPITLSNPLSQDMSVMRATLLPGLLQAVHHNLRYQTARVRLFETGLCFAQEKSAGELVQTDKCALVATGLAYEEQWGEQKRAVDFYDLKADVEALLQLSHDRKFSWQALSDNPVLHPGRSAALYIDDKCVGYLGELHPKVRQAMGIKQPVIVGEFLLSALVQAHVPQFAAFSKFPAVRRDLALLVNESVSADQLISLITNDKSFALQSVQIFDVYQGEGVENGKKSIALGLTFQDASRTLKDEEITQIIHGVVTMLEKKCNATLRT